MHLQRYFSEQLGLGFLSAPCDAVRGYRESDPELEVRLARLHDRAPGSRCLILISARSSGSLELRLKSLAEKLWPVVDAVNLFGIRGDESEPNALVLCLLPPEYARFGNAPCDLCKAGVPLVRVDPHTYLLEVSAVAQRSNLAFKDAACGKAFMERYRGQSVVSLHRTRRDTDEPARHHMVHINVERMLNLEDFRVRLRAELEPLTSRFQSILAPSHHAARALAEQVAALSGAPLVVRDEEGLRDLNADETELLGGTGGLLIVDDVVMTGHRLRGYIRRLRELPWFDLRRPLHMIVAVARPMSDAQFARVQDILLPEKLVYVEKLVLPDWDEKECPWCREAQLLSSLSIGGSEYFRRRAAALRDTDVGLTDEVFLRLDDSQAEMSLTDSPVFGVNLTQAELFFVVASAIQEMRNRNQLLEYAQPPLAKVLSPDGYLTGRYFEAIIDAAICRASRRFDLRSSTVEPELIAKVGRRLAEAISHDLRAELLMTIAQGRLPPPPEMRNAIAAAAGPESAVWAQLTGLP